MPVISVEETPHEWPEVLRWRFAESEKECSRDLVSNYWHHGRCYRLIIRAEDRNALCRPGRPIIVATGRIRPGRISYCRPLESHGSARSFRETFEASLREVRARQRHRRARPFMQH